MGHRHSVYTHGLTQSLIQTEGKTVDLNSCVPGLGYRRLWPRSNFDFLRDLLVCFHNM